MSKFIAVSTLAVLGFGLGILTVMNGWGLKPHSWPWIVGGFLGGCVLRAVNVAIQKEK